MTLSKKDFIAHIKRDKKAPWSIVKRQKFFVAHAKLYGLLFSALIALSYLDVLFCMYVSIMSLKLLP